MTAQTKQYQALLMKAQGLLRQDAEGKFKLAEIAEQMLDISGSVQAVADDLGMFKWNVRALIFTAQYWGAERSSGGTWASYQKVAYTYRGEPEKQAAHRAAFLAGGSRGLYESERAFDHAAREEQVKKDAAYKKTPAGRAQSRKKRAGSAAVMIGMACGAVEKVDVNTRKEDLAVLAARWEELTALLVNLGAVELKKSGKRAA